MFRRSHYSRRGSTSAFSLLESMIAVALLVLIGVVVLRSFSNSAVIPSRALNTYWANELAISVLEEYVATYPQYGTDGVWGDFTWTIRETSPEPIATTALDDALSLVTVAIEVSNETRRLAELERTILRPSRQ